jgi:sec-independent protein translocase protein TatC
MTTEAPVQDEMSLLDHLNELRTRLVKVAAAVVLGTILGYALFPQMLDVLIEPYCSVILSDNPTGECNLIILKPLEAFSVRIKVAMLAGTFLGGPVIFWQLWRFIAPGLTSKERKLSAPFVFISQVLFGLGIGFAWFVLPKALGILTTMGGPRIVPNLTAAEYISFVLTTSVAFGVVFLLPVVLTFLALLGVLTSKSMRRARPYAIVGVAIVSAVVTPTTDPVTMMAMMAPMIIFYEVSILFAALFERRRRKEAAKIEADDGHTDDRPDDVQVDA